MVRRAAGPPAGARAPLRAARARSLSPRLVCGRSARRFPSICGWRVTPSHNGPFPPLPSGPGVSAAARDGSAAGRPQGGGAALPRRGSPAAAPAPRPSETRAPVTALILSRPSHPPAWPARGASSRPSTRTRSTRPRPARRTSKHSARCLFRPPRPQTLRHHDPLSCSAREGSPPPRNPPGPGALPRPRRGRRAPPGQRGAEEAARRGLRRRQGGARAARCRLWCLPNDTRLPLSNAPRSHLRPRRRRR